MALATVFLAPLTPLGAADGVWSNGGGGSWAAAQNWTDGVPASGAGATANFEQLDIGRPMLVTLDGPQLVGRIVFGDTVAGDDWFVRKGSSGGITFDGAGTAPEVRVSAGSATLGVDLTGSGGLRKTGPGVLVLSGDNQWSGPTWIEAGTLRLASPPSFPSSMKVMPLGDSITYGGNGSDAGYRSPLYQKLSPLAPGFQYVGTSILSPGSLPSGQRGHDGRPSYNIRDIHNNLDGFDNTRYLDIPTASRDPLGGHWLTGGGGTGRLPMFPDVVLLKVGTNDLGQLEGADERFRGLLEKILTLRPQARLLVAKITPVTYNDTELEFNSMVTAVTGDMRAEGWNVRAVDLHTGFPANGLLADGLHPNPAGYEWMASQWSEAIVSAYSAEGGPSAGLPVGSTVTVAAGATLDLAGTQSATGNIVAYGTVDLGENAVLSTAGLVLVNGSALKGSGTIYGTVIHNGMGLCGAGQNITFNGSFVNNGNLIVPPGSSLTFNGPVTNNGVLTGRAAGGVVFNGTVTNNGTVRMTGGAALEAFGTFTNAGFVDLLTGGQALPEGFVNLGTMIDASALPLPRAVLADGRFELWIDSHSGHFYQLQRSPDLLPGSWVNEGDPLPGNTGTALRFRPSMANPRGFFRVGIDP
jgi:autotransporter-associated beta strand protein